MFSYALRSPDTSFSVLKLLFGFFEPRSIPTYKEACARCLETFKREYLSKVIEIAGGNITKAAKLMDIPRPSLHEMLRNLE